MASISPSSPEVALLGSGEMATQLALLWAAAGVPLTVWARSEERLGWLIEDVLEEHSDAVLHPADSPEAVAAAAPVLVPALPWGPPLNETLRALLPLLPGRTVLDISNPYEMTALGPKLAHYVPGGSAAAAVADLLPAGTGHVHAFTHIRSAALAAGATAGAPLPYVSNAVHDDDAVAALGATGWVPVRVGGIAEAALIEASGPWDRAAGRDGLGLTSPDAARGLGLL